MLDAVAASGQPDRTLIVFASDNGCAAYFPGLCGCWPLRGGKLSYYEGGIRVPFVMSWPGHVPSGQVYRRMVSLLDVVPTTDSLSHETEGGRPARDAGMARAAS